MRSPRRAWRIWPDPICFGWLLLVSPLLAFATTNSAPQYSSRLWQMEDGLPHVIVHAITQTRDGYLWVGTREGLARFDGVRFEPVTLTPRVVQPTIAALCGARDGSLWVGTENSGVFHVSEGRIVHLSTSIGVTNMGVSEIEETSDGKIWVNSTEGVLRFENGRLQLQEGSRRPAWAWSSIAASKDGSIWAVSDGLKHIVNGVVTNLTGPGIPNTARKLICGRDGAIWIGVNGGMYQIKNGTSTYYRKGVGPNSYVSVIFEDRDGRVWIGTYLGLYQLIDGQFVNQSENDETYRVYAIYQDREGNIWVGSEQGLARLAPKRFTTYTKRQGLTENNIVGVCPSHDGSVWISVWGTGINHLNGNTNTVYNHSNGLATDFVLGMCEGRDGSLWIGTDGGLGLHRLKAGKITRYDRAPGWNRSLLPVITALCEDHTGVLWVGTRDFVARFEDEKFTCFTTENRLSNNKINAICEDSNHVVWLGTDLGLTKWENGKFTKFIAPELERPVLSLYLDAAGTLWLGTREGGLGRIKDGDLKMFTSRQGLYSDSIYAILEDTRDNLWLNTSKGIFHVSKKSVDDVLSGKAPTSTSITYGKTDGILSSAGQYREVTQPSACKTLDGRLWFRTTQGVTVVNPEEITVNTQAPPVVIEEILADKKPLTPVSVSHEVNHPLSVFGDALIHIPPGGGELEIRYTALSFSAAEKNHFKYRLEGVDSDWVDAGTRRYAYYNNVTPGDHRFHVIAANNDGIWNTQGATLSLKLHPHFWQTWWFLAACGFTVAGTIAGSVRYITWKKMQRKLERVEQQHAIEKERARIARDMHDELGAKLTRISFQGASAKRGLSNPTEVAQQIERMSQTARDLVSSLDEIVWAVDPENDTLDHLANYICRHASEYFEHSHINCRLVIPANLPHRRLSTDVRHNVFLAVKEALTNVLKHSEAKNVDLRLTVRDSEFEISITDDGRGFDSNSPATGSNTKRTGHGLPNIRDRLVDVNGRAEIVSQTGTGTCVRLVAPIVEDDGMSSIHLTHRQSRPGL